MTDDIKIIVQWMRIIGTTKDGDIIDAPVTQPVTRENWMLAKDLVVLAADLLEKLACERDQWKARCEAAERDINTVLHGGLICSMCNQLACPEYGNDEVQPHYCDKATWRGPCEESGGEKDG